MKAPRDMPRKAAKTLDLKVVREATFSRVYADNAAAFPLGRDVEVAFMVMSPDISVIEASPESPGSELTMEAVYVEVCRVRMSPQSATSAAFNVIFALLQDDKLDANSLRTNIEDMISQAKPGSEATKSDD